MKKFISNLFIFLILELLINIFYIYYFKPLLLGNYVLFPFAINKFNIVERFPVFWKYFKISFFILNFISNYIIYNSLYKRLTHSISNLNKEKIDFNYNPNELYLYLGLNENKEKVFIPENGLYQNILITGTIGSGKTSSAIIPFISQLLNYKTALPMLILDVKGNLLKNILPMITSSGRSQDLIVLSLDSNYTYNPLHKPNLKPSLLAHRIKSILELFSPETTESYWLDKVEQVLTECIKFCRLYNNGYVNFEEIHNIVTSESYYNCKLISLKEKYFHGNFSDSQLYDLSSCIDFFEKEFFSMDTRNLSILKSEITRITSLFISDYDVLKRFSPPKEKLNFYGFKNLLKKHKILVLNMNIFEHKNLAKVISAYLKIDFQTEVLTQLSKSDKILPSVFVCDEYHEFVTSSDSDFFALSREAKCINILSTQSYTSLLNTLHKESYLNSIIQNIVNKLWFRTDDLLTIENAQKQLGKEEKEKISKTISENARRTKYNFFTKTLRSEDSNISESLNTYTQFDYIYDTNYFSRKLNTFSCLAFLSNGDKIISPQKVILTPYFNNSISNEVNTNSKRKKFHK